MQPVIIGIHQRTAPVALRERLAFGPDELCGALRTLAGYTAEGYILSTCNRVEVGGLAEDREAGAMALRRFLADWHFLPEERFAPYLATFAGEEAVRHVFRLAAGLDSMVLGEDQILGQLKQALAAAHAAGAIGPVLHRMLHSALAAGKRARSATAIGHSHLSVVSVALERARQVAGPLSEQRFLVIGAGRMAELALKHIGSRGARSIGVANRTPERAAALAGRYGAAAWPMEALPAALRASDVVISCTAAPGYVLDTAAVAAAVEGRAAPLVLLDLAVPRDIDPQMRETPGVALIDIDDLQATAAANRAARAAAAAHAEQIVAAEAAKFAGWLAAQRAVPTIRALHERAEAIRAAELRRTLARCPELTDEQRAAIDSLTAALVNKLLHHPITALKDPDHVELAPVVEELFALER